MKVAVKETEKKSNKKQYPYLGEHYTGLIVLFYKPAKGVVLKASETSIFTIGEHVDFPHSEIEFKPFEKEIILSND